MSKLPDLPSYEFTVELIDPEDGALDELRTVTAAYLQEDRSYTWFKDASHTAVAAYKTAYVVAIVRGQVVDAAE
jgi:hypothetical protein